MVCDGCSTCDDAEMVFVEQRTDTSWCYQTDVVHPTSNEIIWFVAIDAAMGGALLEPFPREIRANIQVTKV